MSMNPFESQLQRLARTLTEQFGVEVISQGENAYTNGKVIVLPSLPDPMSDPLERMVVGKKEGSTKGEVRNAKDEATTKETVARSAWTEEEEEGEVDAPAYALLGAASGPRLTVQEFPRREDPTPVEFSEGEQIVVAGDEAIAIGGHQRAEHGQIVGITASFAIDVYRCNDAGVIAQQGNVCGHVRVGHAEFLNQLTAEL